MRIKKILSQNRRDFRAIYQCEHCDAEHEGSGYDDSYFHNEVIPAMICKSCEKKAGDDYRAYAPKYVDGVQV